MRTLTTHSSTSWDLLQLQWRLRSCFAIQAYLQALLTGVPTWLSLPRNRWPKDWEKKCWQPMVPMLLALYGHPNSGGIWEQHISTAVRRNKVGNKFCRTCGIQSFIIRNSTVSLWFTLMTLRWQDHPRESAKAWASIKSAVDIGEPEAYDRYFGCCKPPIAQRSVSVCIRL